MTVGVLAGAALALVPLGGAAAASGSASSGSAGLHALIARPAAASHSMSTTMSHKLARLRSCESGGRYGADTGNGYYGAYQFADPTWHALGFHGLPSNASADTQDAAALALHSRSGWSPWPVCSKRENL